MNELLKPGERVDDLRRGGLRIIQNPAAPCFSVDAVLLADFCKPAKGDDVVDLGTGTGIISLLLAHKQPGCHIRALELMPQMAEMAQRSVDLNELENHINIINGDMRQAAALLGKASCNVVVSNPPYFALGSGRENTQPLFAAARSEYYCSIAQLAREAAGLLMPGGSLCLIHRANRFTDVLAALLAEDLRPCVLRFVQPYAYKPANLFLLKAVKGGKAESQLLPPFVVYDTPGNYTEEMQRIYGEA